MNSVQCAVFRLVVVLVHFPLHLRSPYSSSSHERLINSCGIVATLFLIFLLALLLLSSFSVRGDALMARARNLVTLSLSILFLSDGRVAIRHYLHHDDALSFAENALKEIRSLCCVQERTGHQQVFWRVLCLSTCAC